MKIIKIGDEVYLEYTTTKELIRTLAKVIGLAVLGLFGFCCLWILSDVLR